MPSKPYCDTFESVLIPGGSSALCEYHLSMSWIRLRINLCAAILCGYCSLAAPAQDRLALVHQINLPVHTHPGTFGGGFWAIGMSADEVFQMKIAPDQSVLVFYPNTSGKWPLIRVRKWWTPAPEIEQLELPGWTESNTRYEFDIGTDLLVTPDGKYAVALGSVGSVKDAAHIPFPPSESIEHKPDLLITVVDLEQWRIVGALHSATVDPNAEFRGAYIVNGKWIALQGMDEERETVEGEHLYDRVNRLISLPDLKPGPGCISRNTEVKTLDLGGRPKQLGVLGERHEEDCATLLAATRVSSMRALEWLIYLGRDPEPKSLMVQTEPSMFSGQSQSGRAPNSSEPVGPDGEYHPGDWTSNEWDIYFKNPPFESSARKWYQLRQSNDKPPYQLDEYALDGQLLNEKEPDLESKPQCSTRWGCDCTIADVSAQQGAILALCRVQSVNFTGGFDWHKQWVTLFRMDNFSLIGDADLAATYTRAAIAAADGHTYVVTVERGKVLRIYSAP